MNQNDLIIQRQSSEEGNKNGTKEHLVQNVWK